MAEEEILSDFNLDLALEGLAMRGDVNEMAKLVKTLGEQIKLSKERLVQVLVFQYDFTGALNS